MKTSQYSELLTMAIRVTCSTDYFVNLRYWSDINEIELEVIHKNNKNQTIYTFIPQNEHDNLVDDCLRHLKNIMVREQTDGKVKQKNNE